MQRWIVRMSGGLLWASLTRPTYSSIEEAKNAVRLMCELRHDLTRADFEIVKEA